MPSLHNHFKSDADEMKPKSWMPDEFTSVPRSSVFSPKPAEALEPMTLEKIGWSEKLPSFLNPPTAPRRAAVSVQTDLKNITSWMMPDISQFAPRNEEDAPVLHQPGVNTALDYAEKIRAEAEQEAEEILAAARARAVEIEAASLQEAEERRQQAYEDGMEASRQEAAAIIQSAQTILEEAHNWKQRTMAESEPAIVEMIKSISQDLFGEGYILNVREIEGVITRAISQASRLGDLRIYMNPDDAMELISLWQESEIVLNGQKIAIVSSQNIQRGGCFIDGQYGMVDSRLPEQLSQIHKTLDNTLNERPTDEE